MKKFSILFVVFAVAAYLNAQDMKPESTEWYSPQPPKVVPAKTLGQAPSDAIVLFDGKDLSNWVANDGSEAKWKVINGEMVVEKGAGDILTKQYFGDCQLHVEFKSPKPSGDGQGRGNSGIFLQSIYEVQVLDGDNNPTYVNGMVGSIYKQQAPLADAYTKNGEWQTFDIFWKAPQFTTGGKLKAPAMITVLLNGILIQNNYILEGTTEWIGFPKYNAHGRLPLMLQNHGDPVSYRNIWIRNL